MKYRAMLVKAVALHRQGDAAGAEKLYRGLLAADPRNADALHLLGILLRQRGSIAEAVDYLINACAAMPSNSGFLVDCAEALREYTLYEDAAAFYGLALKTEPANANIWFALGCAHHRGGNIDAALAAMQSAVDYKPDFFEALCNLSELRRLKNDFDEAVSCISRALALRPDFAEAHNAAGKLYEAVHNPEKALFHYNQAIRLDKSFADAYNNLGNFLSARGDRRAAIDSYKQALSVKADFFEAHYNLGNCLRDLHALDEALLSFAAAIKIKPQSVPALSNYAEGLMVAGRISEAQTCLKSILGLPGAPPAAVYSNLLLCMNYDPAHSPQSLYAAHVRVKNIFPRPSGGLRRRGPSDPLRAIRIGYVSADFCNHPVARFIEPVLTHHDSERFEIFCYANHHRGDDVTKRLQALPLAWRGIADRGDERRKK